MTHIQNTAPDRFTVSRGNRTDTFELWTLSSPTVPLGDVDGPSVALLVTVGDVISLVETEDVTR